MRDTALDKRSITPSLLNRLWEHEKLSYALRIFIALLGSALVCWYLNDIVALATVFLGLIASAVAETDDNWVGRTKAVALQMVCFTLASAGVVVLFPYPLAFLFGLMVATFSVIQLGALGPRYVMIAQATLTLSTYAMVTVDRTTGMAEAWKSIIPLLGGAAWYGVLSIIWFGLLANRPVRDRLANLFNALNRLLQAKADLVEPVREADQHALRLKVAKCNGEVVEALNSAKAAITSRFGRSGRPGVESGFYFRLYFLAQDVQERASSTHYVQSDVTDAYFHSDVLYRVGRLTRLQGDACASLAQAIRKLTPFEPSARVRSARAELDASIDYLRTSGSPQQKRMLGTLELAVQNLGKVERQMSEAVAPDSTLDNVDTRMRDSSPRTLQEMWARIRQQFTPKSTFFRHGVRMAVALAAGYMLQPLLPLLGINNGYWLMMTTVFVSRNSYATTRLRMFQRIFGTFFGVPAAWAILQLVPSIEAQMFLASAAALIFLTTRATNYMLASAAVSVMALLCFNQMGDGYVALAPRLLDTVIGAMIAFLAASLILPDWQGKRVHTVGASVLKNSARYLDEVLAHYREEGRDMLAYRAARRDMHAADAALSAVMAGVLREPAKYRGNVDAGFRFLALSNTLLSYLSALGSHRGALDRNPDGELIAAAGQQLQQALNETAAALAQRQVPPAGDPRLEEELAGQLDAVGTETPETPEPHVGVDHTAGERRLIRSQLALMLRMLPSIRSAASTLVQDKGRDK